MSGTIRRWLVCRPEFDAGFAHLQESLADVDVVAVPQVHTHVVAVKKQSDPQLRRRSPARPASQQGDARRIAADVAVIRDGAALLVKRAFPPDAGMWAIPGGYVERNESAEEAAARELREETSIVLDWCELVAVQSAPERHPEQLITILFIGDGEGEVRAGDDALEAKWFPLDSLPGSMALDHRVAVEKAAAVAASRLRNRH